MELKRSKDYIDEINLLFPEVSKNDIKRIMDYGWKLLYLLNSYGGDTIVKDNELWCYIGRLTYDSLSHYLYYVRKLAKRLRILHKRKKIQWDGYYYFAINDKQWENYLSQIHKGGRPRKNFNFGTVHLYKILDECKLRHFESSHIFRIYYGIDCGYVMFKEDFKSGKAELIETRDKPKFKDILTINYKYDILWHKHRTHLKVD